MNSLPLHGAAFEHNFKNRPALQTSSLWYISWYQRRVVLPFSGTPSNCGGSYMVFYTLCEFSRAEGEASGIVRWTPVMPYQLIWGYLCITYTAERPLMEVGGVYFPFVWLLHHTFCLTFIICKLHHTTFAGLCVLSDEVMCCCIGRGGLLDA